MVNDSWKKPGSNEGFVENVKTTRPQAAVDPYFFEEYVFEEY